MSIAQLLAVGVLVFTAVTCVVIGDTAGKLLTSSGVDPLLVAWSRFAVAALVLLPFSGLTRAELRLFADWRLFLRAGLVAGGIACILTALRTEPIADVFGAFFIGPIVSYALAVVLLGERPSLARAVLLAVGFAGVLLVVKPGFGMSPGILFAVAAGCFYGGYLAATRALAGGYRPRFLLISQLLIGAVLLAPFGTTAVLPPLTPGFAALICISALASAAGNFLLVMANKRAEAGVIAPLVYTQLFSATILGVLVFGEWPDALSGLGLGLIAASGFGSLALQRRAGAV